MKKILSLALVFAASLSVSAQEVCQIDAESKGITSEAATIAAGTVVGESANLTITVLCEDQVKSTSCKGNNSGFIVGGAELKASGITGSNNPKNSSGNPALYPAAGIPTTGFAINIAVKADGYLYVCGKLSTNKNYYVFEEGTMIGYDLAMWCDTEAQFQPLSINVPNDAENDQGIAYRAGTVAWPEVIFTGDENSALKKSGEGVIKFPVYAGCNYVVGAGGSKISVCGAVFSTDGNLAVVLPETTSEDGVTEFAHTIMGTVGISEINAAQPADANAPVYNVAGQRVNRATKGVVIVNGNKFINK